MDNKNVYLNSLLQENIKRLEEQQVELKKLPEGGLIREKTAGGIKYSVSVIDKTDGEKTTKRTRITNNPKLLRQMARKKYLEISNKLHQEEIDSLRKYIDRHIELTPDNIIELLPKAYNQLPEEYFFPKRRQQEQWAQMNYLQNTSHLDKKIHTTSRGMKVRSKSEGMIVEKLYEYNIQFRYEPVITIEGIKFSPDFQMPRLEDGQIMYWEHCGMMGIDAYRERNLWKMTMYQNAGIVPWKNLIVTYDDEDGGINMAIIEAEIRNKLM